MSSRDNYDRPRDRERDRERRPREDAPRSRDERGGTPNDRFHRSRSPRRERGGRRSENKRYRSRSPFRKDEHSARDERDRDRGDRTRRDRSPPRGPRSIAGASSRSERDRDGERDRKLAYPSGGPVKPTPSGPRPIKSEDPEVKDIKPLLSKLQRPEDQDEETWEETLTCLQTMGFAGFKTTQNTKVPGNDKNFAIRRDKKMEARQYMNRQGGFNRPLSPGR